MEDLIALIDQLVEEHKVTFQQFHTLEQVANDSQALAVLEKSKEAFIPGRLNQEAGLKEMRELLETIVSGLEAHFNREETRLLAAFEQHGDKILASALHSLLQVHGELRTRLATSQHQIADLTKGEMSQGVWGANASGLQAYLSHTLKLLEDHARDEQKLLRTLKEQLLKETRN